MLCEICHKNEATIHIQEIINSQKKALHICQECASKKNSGNGMFNGLNLADILYNISSNISNPQPSTEQPQDKTVTPVPVITCDKCGWTTANFSEKGRIGCANCYNVFREILSLALKNMHKGTIHVGKRPGARRPGDEEAGRNAIEIMKLQKQLEEHVLREEYEKAAQVRDRISSLKGKTKKGR